MLRLALIALVAVVLVGAAVVTVVIAVPAALLPPPDCPLHLGEGTAEAQAAAIERGLLVLCLYDEYGRLTSERRIAQPTRPAPTLAPRNPGRV